MAFYSFIFTANYKRYFSRIRKVAKEEKRSVVGLVLDTGWCVFRYGLALSDYLNYKIYNRSTAERKEYAGVRVENTFYEAVSPSAHKHVFSFKPAFMEQFGAYTKRSYLVPAEDNYDEFLEFLRTHDTFMSKPYDGLAGQDVKKVHAKDIADPRAYFEDCIKNRYFLDELVIQHPDMNVLCPTSVNTMRVMTFHDHGKSEIIWMGLRVGNGVHPVDNFHADGTIVGIDQQTGRLVGNAVNTEQSFTHHPVTGVQFDGFQIPCFEEAKALALQAALENDKILVVGWDVAISENGPLIIEGNRRPGFVLPQMVDNRGAKGIMRSVLSRVRPDIKI